MKKRKLEVGCFWCDMTREMDPFIYWMEVVEADHYGKFHPVTSVKLPLDVYQMFESDGKALRQCLTKIGKIDEIDPITCYEDIQ